MQTKKAQHYLLPPKGKKNKSKSSRGSSQLVKMPAGDSKKVIKKMDEPPTNKQPPYRYGRAKQSESSLGELLLDWREFNES